MVARRSKRPRVQEGDDAKSDSEETIARLKGTILKLEEELQQALKHRSANDSARETADAVGVSVDLGLQPNIEQN